MEEMAETLVMYKQRCERLEEYILEKELAEKEKEIYSKPPTHTKTSKMFNWTDEELRIVAFECERLKIMEKIKEI